MGHRDPGHRAFPVAVGERSARSGLTGDRDIVAVLHARTLRGLLVGHEAAVRATDVRRRGFATAAVFDWHVVAPVASSVLSRAGASHCAGIAKRLVLLATTDRNHPCPVREIPAAEGGRVPLCRRVGGERAHEYDGGAYRSSGATQVAAVRHFGP